ncbi:MAG: hypothetical protein ACM3IH_05240 [Sphingobacteriales bacterium]
MEAERAVAFSLETTTAALLKKRDNRPVDTICNESDETLLAIEVSDEALEAAASQTRDGAAAMSYREHFDHALRQRVSGSAIC